MALPAQITQLGDVPEWAHEYYKQEASGYALQVQTVPIGEDVTGLKTALASERRLKREAETALQTLQQEYGDITPERARHALKQLDDLGDADLLNKEGVEAVITKRLQAVNDAHNKRIQEEERKRIKLAEERDTAIKQRIRDRIDTHIRAVAIASGVNHKENMNAIDEVVMLGQLVFTTVDENDQAIALDRDGEIRRGKDGLKPYTIADWIEDMKPTKGHWFATSSGAGSPGGLGGVPGSQIDWNALPPTERLTKYREMQRVRSGT